MPSSVNGPSPGPGDRSFPSFYVSHQQTSWRFADLTVYCAHQSATEGTPNKNNHEQTLSEHEEHEDLAEAMRRSGNLSPDFELRSIDGENPVALSNSRGMKAR